VCVGLASETDEDIGGPSRSIFRATFPEHRFLISPRVFVDFDRAEQRRILSALVHGWLQPAVVARRDANTRRKAKSKDVSNGKVVSGDLDHRHPRVPSLTVSDLTRALEATMECFDDVEVLTDALAKSGEQTRCADQAGAHDESSVEVCEDETFVGALFRSAIEVMLPSRKYANTPSAVTQASAVECPAATNQELLQWAAGFDRLVLKHGIEGQHEEMFACFRRRLGSEIKHRVRERLVHKQMLCEYVHVLDRVGTRWMLNRSLMGHLVFVHFSLANCHRKVPVL